MTLSPRGATLALLPALASVACAAPRAVLHPAPLAAVDGVGIPASTSRFTLRYARTSTDTLAAMGTRTVIERTSVAGSATLLERVIRYDYGSHGQTVDTTLSNARTLAPINERTYTPNGHILLDFAGRIVTGQVTKRDSTRAVADTLAAPAFNSTDLDLVASRLPLADGYATRIPLYDPEFGGFRYADAKVSTRPMPNGGSMWVVEVRDRQLACEYDIDARTRELDTIIVRMLASGGEFRMDRIAG